MPCRLTTYRLWLAVLAVALAAGFGGTARASGGTSGVSHVLVLNSWHSDQPWHKEFERGLRAGLERADTRAQVFVESLDVARLPQPDLARVFGRHLEEKYAGVTIDIVLAESLPARMFLNANPGLFPKASRIYAGTGISPGTGRTGNSADGTLSVSMEADFEGAISEMVQVAQPRSLVVVGDTSDAAGRERLQGFRAALAARYPELPVTELVNLPMEALLGRLSQLPARSAVFYLLIFRDGNGKAYVPYEAARLVAERSAAPVFSHWSTLMGSGILGGYLLSAERVGHASSRIMAALARGERAADARNEEAFERRYDWRQVARWGIDRTRLSPEATVDFYQSGLFETYRREILAVLAVTLTISLLCVILFVTNRRLQSAHAALDGERQRLEERVSARTAELKEEIAVKNRLFSIVAHDLRGPFNALLGMTQLASQMSEKFSKTQLIELAGVANQEGRRIFAHLSNLLEWSRLQMDGSRPVPERVPLGPLVDEICGSLESQSTRKNLTIRNQAGEAAVFSDRTMIRTVLDNLIVNAVKFTPAGGAVSVLAEVSDDTVRIIVDDTGVGIAEPRLARLFSVGDKTSTPGTDGEPGTGLGLPICKEMVERNGGQITVTSIVGAGTRFQVTLPASPAGALLPPRPAAAA